MSYVWTFEPDDLPPEPVKEFEPKPKKPKATSWTAPEHIRMAQDMKRDFPRNEMGERIEGKDRELKLDPRPTIMLPPRRTRIGWL
jgi:hypothetical protein